MQIITTTTTFLLLHHFTGLRHVETGGGEDYLRGGGRLGLRRLEIINIEEEILLLTLRGAVPRVLSGLVELVNNTDLLETLAEMLKFLNLDLFKELLGLGLTPSSSCRRLRWRSWSVRTVTESLQTRQTAHREL